MKKYLNFRFVFVFCMVLSLILAHPLAVFADVKDLMISTDSNALMTLDLVDDYSVSTFSSLSNISNTVNYSYVNLFFRAIDHESGMSEWIIPNYLQNDGSYKYYVPTGKTVTHIGLYYKSGSLPPAGVYRFQIDHSSDISFDLKSMEIYTGKTYKNAAEAGKTLIIYNYLDQASGDFYIDFDFNIGNLSFMTMYGELEDHLGPGSLLSGQYKFNFSKTSNSPDFSSVGIGDTTLDYENGVSSSLSDLSSSVGEMSDEISGVTSAIEALAGAMEPHYNNVLTQLHHITEQLHAFWDQQFNLHHVPLMAKLGDIIDAIGNMDLEVEVNLNSLKTSIDTMSQAVQNKLQSVSDTITGGYDNSGIESENDELSGAVDELDQAEKEVLDDVTGYIEGFEYPTFESLSGGLLGAISFFGGYLQSMFLAMGDFGLIITFSLTMIFVLIIVGYHRIRT